MLAAANVILRRSRKNLVAQKCAMLAALLSMTVFRLQPIAREEKGGFKPTYWFTWTAERA
jgi:hypothetical protein